MSSDLRSEMREFWKQNSKDASVKEMMLDSMAEVLSPSETEELVSYLPSFHGKDVVELGAGIGRYTRLLAEHAKSLLAVDFEENFLKKNKELNHHHFNITFQCADVTKLKLQANSADMIFSNWLLMYLGDEEVKALIKSKLSWLREGGYAFIRESCYRPSGDTSVSFNPTKYRDPGSYDGVFRSVSLPTEDHMGVYVFELVFLKPVYTYVKIKNNNSQMAWLLQKVRKNKDRDRPFYTLQDISKEEILCEKKIFGGEPAPGGLKTTEELVMLLDLKNGQRVLDVGAGIGGSAFFLAQTYDVHVVTIDLSTNRISTIIEQAQQLGVDKVKFEVGDVTKTDYPVETFDVVYSRDCLLHIQDKLKLFRKFYSWLKQGGKLLITDYCCKDGEHSEEYRAYVKQHGYYLVTTIQFGKDLSSAGFVHVKVEDRTDSFIQVLTRQLCQSEKLIEEEFTENVYNTVFSDWKKKLEHCLAGDLRWGFLYSEKPKPTE